MAAEMGVEILTEEQYRFLQQLGKFDLKTSSWVKTTPEVRKLGGAFFCDRRYDTVFLNHNGADSYYAARGFRGSLRVYIFRLRLKPETITSVFFCGFAYRFSFGSTPDFQYFLRTCLLNLFISTPQFIPLVELKIALITKAWKILS